MSSPRATALLTGLGLLLVTLLLFGPLGAFHHMIRFGALGYMVLDADSDGPFIGHVGDYGVRLSVAALVVTALLWLAAVGAAVALLRAAPSRRP